MENRQKPVYRKTKNIKAENQESKAALTSRHMLASGIKNIQGHQSVQGREGQAERGNRGQKYAKGSGPK